VNQTQRLEVFVIHARWNEQLVRFGVPQDLFDAWVRDAAKSGLRYFVVGIMAVGRADPIPCPVGQLDLLEASRA